MVDYASNGKPMCDYWKDLTVYMYLCKTCRHKATMEGRHSVRPALRAWLLQRPMDKQRQKQNRSAV